MSRFTDLLADSSAERRFLLILEPYDPAASAIAPVYLSSHGFTSGPADTPANVHFEGRIKDGYTFRRSLFSQGRLSGRTIPNQGDIVLINTDGGLDRLAGYGWGGRRVRVFLGGEGFAFSEYGQVFEGTAQGLAFSDTDITVNLRDLAYLVDREVQPATFAGTGGAEGSPELAGKRKPDAFGLCTNVEPIYLGPSSGRHLFRVASGPIIDVTAVYDRGVPLTYAASNPAAGQWSVDLETATVTLGGAFNGPVTCDVTGRRYLSTTSTTTATVDRGAVDFTVADGTIFTPGQYVQVALTTDMHGAWMYGFVLSVTATVVRINLVVASGSGTYSNWTISAYGTVAGILRHLAARIGVTSFDTVRLAALESLQPSSINYWIPEGGNAAEALDAIADATGCFWGFDRAGRFTAGRIDVPGTTPTARFDATQILGIERLATDEPSSQILLRSNRNWRPLTTDQIAGVADSRKVRLTNEWEFTNIFVAATATAYPLGKALTIDTLFTLSGALGDETFRVRGLYSVRRDYFRVRLRLQAATLDLGATVRITHPRYGLAAGRNFRVVDLDEDLDAGEITLGVWG